MDTDPIYSEKYRPQFHFTAKKGWLNDPNGLVFYKGEYHLFYQHNPFGTDWGNMHWGHAVSPDLVHWEELQLAIAPDHNGTIYSGSAVVDWHNTSGFKTGKDDVIVAAYTGEEHGQCIAYSNDKGRTWTRYEGNTVIPFFPDRDPKVIWHAPTGRWVMVLYVEKASRKGQPGIAFFTSNDLKSWEYQSEITGFYECPDLFELPVDGNTENMKWVLLGAGDRHYITGDFDGIKFTPDSDMLSLDYGANFYASQTYSDIPKEDGRRIQIAWMNGGVYPEMPFNQQMTFPCELTLVTSHDGLQINRFPVKEIECLRKSPQALSSPESVKADLMDIEFQVPASEDMTFEIDIRGKLLKYAQNNLSLMDNTAQLKPVDGKIKLRILVDRTSIEVFGNGGLLSMSSCYLPDADKQMLSYTGPETAVFSIYELKSAWI